MTKKEKREMYQSFFLNEGAINYILKMNKGALEDRLKVAKNYSSIPATDAEDLLSQLQDVDFLSIERISPWEFSTIPVLNYNGEVRNLSCSHANFGRVNKWGNKQPYKYFQIIYSDNYFVTWFGNILTGGPVFWVSVKNTICRITYNHKTLTLYPNICSEPELLVGLDQVNMDNVVKKYYKHLRIYDPKFIVLEYETGHKQINLDNHFPKGFFYKGPKYNYGEFKKVNYYAWIPLNDVSKKEISEIRDVRAENGLFKIEIENNTYPHSGWAYLDITKMEVVGVEYIGEKGI